MIPTSRNDGCFHFWKGGTHLDFRNKQCGWCRKAVSFFQKHDIDFVEYDIGESYKNKQKYDELGGRGTPLIYIGGNRIDGFNEKAVKMALRKVGLM
ncbi:MAG: hypothetical protein GY749_37880 [Desulfobacteraceae bacterium]|nr:hypothetical protein [Desulfobacteraceae bacterium]